MSCDSRFTLAAWRQAMGYDLRLLSDFWPHGAVARAFGAFDERLGIATRSTFVIDAGGVIREVIASPSLGTARDVSLYVDAVRRLM